jgi:hypothetical protein
MPARAGLRLVCIRFHAPARSLSRWRDWHQLRGCMVLMIPVIFAIKYNDRGVRRMSCNHDAALQHPYGDRIDEPG